MSWLPVSEETYSVYPERERHGKPTFPIMREASTDDLRQLELALNRTDRAMINRGLYIHIPFCDTICGFCLFDRVVHSEPLVERYLKALHKAIELIASKDYTRTGTISAVYIGGGTPSALSASQMSALVRQIRSLFKMSDHVEFTVEGNPHNFSWEKIEGIRSEGANRISLGVQTFDDSLRQLLKVPGSGQQGQQIIERIVSNKLNLDIDLLYGIPGQTMDSWKADLEQAIALGVNSVSIYDVIMHPGTSLGRAVMQSKTPAPTTRERMDFFMTAVMTFLHHGYKQQHLYHFCLPGYENEYLKVRFGGNADCLCAGNTGAGRIGNLIFRNRIEYMQWIESCEQELPTVNSMSILSNEELLREFVIKGLELLTIDRTFARNHYGADPVMVYEPIVNKLVARSLLQVDDTAMNLTNQGILWGWNVIKEFYPNETTA